MMTRVFNYQMTTREGCHFASRFAAEGESYETYLRPAYLKAFQRPGMFLDAGAQYGFYSLMALASDPDREVAAFDPMHQNFACLIDTQARNNLASRWFIYNMFADSIVRQGSISQVEDNAMMELGGAGVIGLPLDYLHFHDVAIIKLDLEGMEEHALKGLSSTIQRDKPELIVEVCERNLRFYGSTPESLVSTLQSLGYHNYTIYDYTKLPVKADASLLLSTTYSTYGFDVHCHP